MQVWKAFKELFWEISFLDHWLLFLYVVSVHNFSFIFYGDYLFISRSQCRCSWFSAFHSGTYWMSSSIYSTRRSTIISHIHSMYILANWLLSWNSIKISSLNLWLIWSHVCFGFCIILKIHNYSDFYPFCSFVSVIHLLVGVVYCLVSWSIGLPKRAVSISFFLQLLSSRFKPQYGFH